MLLSQIFRFPSGGKCNFYRFLIFPPEGNAVFAVFSFSLRGETHFLSISDFPPGGNAVLRNFQFFRPGGSVIFSSGKISAAAEAPFF